MYLDISPTIVLAITQHLNLSDWLVHRVINIRATPLMLSLNLSEYANHLKMLRQIFLFPHELNPNPANNCAARDGAV